MGSGPSFVPRLSEAPFELGTRGVSEERSKHPEGFLVHCPAESLGPSHTSLCVQWVPPGTSVTVEEENPRVLFPSCLYCSRAPVQPHARVQLHNVWAGLVDQLRMVLGASQTPPRTSPGGSCRADSCLFPSTQLYFTPLLCASLAGKHRFPTPAFIGRPSLFEFSS